ncbi:hypothetical protein B0H13DRAFT_2043656 [Mycena leptocephala]|nr:hypothetical protein B0H13DRAFT_2043656 [Mycena leptocephala]
MTACWRMASSMRRCASTSNGSALRCSISRCRWNSALMCRSRVCRRSSANRVGLFWAASASSGCASRNCRMRSGSPRICRRIISESCSTALPAAFGTGTLRRRSSIALSSFTPSSRIVDFGALRSRPLYDMLCSATARPDSASSKAITFSSSIPGSMSME